MQRRIGKLGIMAQAIIIPIVAMAIAIPVIQAIAIGVAIIKILTGTGNKKGRDAPFFIGYFLDASNLIFSDSVNF
jgi:hypothetical protein